MSTLGPIDERLLALREAGAARLDPVGWHYIEVLANRTLAQTGAAHELLQHKLDKALQDVQGRLEEAAQATLSDAEEPPSAQAGSSSPLARLLQEMASAPIPSTRSVATIKPAAWPAENPRVRQFRKQLSRISVQKQVRQAIAQAPQNAGPINSHMLVLRALGLMRDISPDYLGRFMTHVDTLLCLEEAERMRLQPRKTTGTAKSKRQT